MDEILEELVRKTKLTRRAVFVYMKEDGKSPANDILHNLEKIPVRYSKITSSIMIVALNPTHKFPNDEKVKHQMEGIYAVKGSKQDRLYGFFDDETDNFIIVNGDTAKKQKKANQAILQQAIRLRAEYYRRQQEK